MFCRVTPCKGVATLSSSGADTSTYGRQVTYGRVGFRPAGEQDRAPADPRQQRLVRIIRAKHGVSATLAAVVNGKTITQQITVKIL